MRDEIASALPIPVWAWLLLGVVLAVSLAVDLFGHRGEHGQSRRAAVLWSVAWLTLAAVFGGFVAWRFGREAGEDWFTAFLVEKSLSLDNLFVFLVVFSRLGIPQKEQHRVLLWGIWGALLARGAFIAAGSALLHAWHGVVYLLGAMLLVTGIKTAREHVAGGEAAEKAGEKEGKILAFIREHIPTTTRLDGHRFFTRERDENGRARWLGTPLFLALVVIEITDVLFAVDSIPAVFAITDEPFIVYSSNVFALLGLRALYLVLADLIADLKYLRLGLAGILVFAGLKMLGSRFFHVPHVVSLVTIIGLLGATVVASVIAKRRAAASATDAS